MAVSRRMWLREQERKRRERERRARRRRNIALLVFFCAAIAVAVIVGRGLSESKKAVVDDPPAATAEAASESPYAVPAAPAPAAAAAVTVDIDYFDNAAFVGNALAAGIDRYGILPYTDFYAGVAISLENVYTTASNNSSMAVADQLKSQKFGKLYLSFGEIELMWNDVRRFEAQYGEFLGKMKSYQPSANIYLISIPPVAETAAAAGNGYSLENIRAYNKAIKTLAAREKVYYIDSFAALGGNYLPAGVSADGVNLNKEYYTRLLAYARKKAVIPDLSQIADSDEEEEEEWTAWEDEADTEEPDPAETGQTVGETPGPTTNVLKSTGKAEQQGGEPR